MSLTRLLHASNIHLLQFAIDLKSVLSTPVSTCVVCVWSVCVCVFEREREREVEGDRDRDRERACV